MMMMMMIVKKNLCWTQAATLLKLEMNLTMQHLLLSMEVDYNKFLTMKNIEHAPPLPLLPSYPLHTGSPAPAEQPTPVRRKQYGGADLSSFCFSPEPSQHPPPSSSSSSSRKPLPRLLARDSSRQIRKPVKHLKGLLSRNIEKAVNNYRSVR
jgi:hypothetical protein